MKLIFEKLLRILSKTSDLLTPNPVSPCNWKKEFRDSYRSEQRRRKLIVKCTTIELDSKILEREFVRYYFTDYYPCAVLGQFIKEDEWVDILIKYDLVKIVNGELYARFGINSKEFRKIAESMQSLKLLKKKGIKYIPISRLGPQEFWAGY